MAKIRQKRLEGAAPKYLLITSSGEEWYCYQWAHWQKDRFSGRWWPVSSAPSWALDIVWNERWHLMRPDGEHEGSFTALWLAKQRVSDIVDRETAEEKK